ncbi:hypothetical protein RGQ29_019640 [Quercus rubra]|uniref:HMA domain-containing protein n=1 Tax=Quercus rubra TaxID=3512 RepID=A0AAN7FAJ6_QUERU|nr:hypothetical protein RGQ29_019640 [Quercus rubra]
MKIPINCQKCQTKALTIAAKANGVNFVELGAEKDEVVVIGDGVDAAMLVRIMRKKVGYTTLVSVAEVREGN